MGRVWACAQCRAQVYAAIHDGGFGWHVLEVVLPVVILAGIVISISLAAEYQRGHRS